MTSRPLPREMVGVKGAIGFPDGEDQVEQFPHGVTEGYIAASKPLPTCLLPRTGKFQPFRASAQPPLRPSLRWTKAIVRQIVEPSIAAIASVLDAVVDAADKGSRSAWRAGQHRREPVKCQ